MVDLPADPRDAVAGSRSELVSPEAGGSALDPDAAYLRSALEQARKQEGGSWLTGMMILSPVGLVILISALFGDWRMKLWAAVFAVGVGFQFLRWKRAEQEVKRLEALLEATTEGAPGPEGEA